MAVDTLARAIAAGKTPVSAYEMAVAGGYTGTLEQFEADMGNSGTNATNAATSAAAAAASAESVSASAAQIAENENDIADLKEQLWRGRNESDTLHVLTYYSLSGIESFDAKTLPPDTWVYAAYSKLAPTFENTSMPDFGFTDGSYLKIEKRSVTSNGGVYTLSITSTQPAINCILWVNTSANATKWIVPDTTLSKFGQAADAKSTGDAIEALKESLEKRIFARAVTDYVIDGTVTLSDIKEDGFYLFSANYTISDGPSNVNYVFPGLAVENFNLSRWGTGKFIRQTLMDFASNDIKLYTRTSDVNGNYYSWKEIAKNYTNNYTNEYAVTQYENTYNVTATPTITADTNQFLASTNDTSDRANDINTLLASSKIARLGPGDFYIDSSITVPNDAVLTGCGNATKIILTSTAGNVPAVIMSDRSQVSNVFLSGSTTSYTPDGELTERHGIYWAGTAIGEATTSSGPKRGTIDNVVMQRFSGGGITLTSTGTNLDNCLNVTNVYCVSCNAGINVSRRAEFNRFVNVHAQTCYCGAINNGGNNIFDSCCFSGNTVGMLMDNSAGQSPNNSHGTVSACIFDHSDNNDGYGLRILGMNAGEIFQGCQFFFSKIYIENSTGIVFSGCNFGAGSTATYGVYIEGVESNGGETTVIMTGCMFRKNPKLVSTGSPAVIVADCYNRDGSTAVITN